MSTVIQEKSEYSIGGEAGRGEEDLCGRVETTGNFEPLTDLLALPFFPLKSALPTLSAAAVVRYGLVIFPT